MTAGYAAFAAIPELLLFALALRAPRFRRLAAQVGLALLIAAAVIIAACMVTVLVAASMNA